MKGDVQFKMKVHELKNTEKVLMLSTAHCNSFHIKLDEYNPPPLSDEFIAAVKEIGDDDKSLFRFYDYWGTHFQKYTLYGSTYTMENKMQKEDFSKRNDYELNAMVEATIEFILWKFTGQIEADGASKRLEKKFTENIETKVSSVGPPPPATMDAVAWAADVKKAPVAISYKLASIEELFTERFMGNSGINYQNLTSRIKNSKRVYCESLRLKGKVDSCESVGAEDEVILDNLSLTGGVLKKLEERVCRENCADDQRCFAISISDGADNCRMYKKHTDSKPFKFEDGKVNMTVVENHAETLSFLNHTKITVFINDMIKSDLVFKINNAKVMDAKRQNREDTYNIEIDKCSEICQNDPMCAAFTFKSISDKSDEVRNCWIYDTNSILSNSVEVTPGYVTVYQPKEKPVELPEEPKSSGGGDGGGDSGAGGGFGGLGNKKMPKAPAIPCATPPVPTTTTLSPTNTTTNSTSTTAVPTTTTP